MFITVRFGAGCRELVNPWCSLVTLTAYLKKRGQISPDVTIALLAEDGHLVSLDKDLETFPSPSLGSFLLQERRTYTLLRVIKGEDGAPNCYESLLENLDDQSPELAEELRRLSGLPTVGNSRRRRLGTRNGLREQDPPSRPRRVGFTPSRTR
ncbi:uncharacterized protein C22orf15 homolog [Thomomys bottae]